MALRSSAMQLNAICARAVAVSQATLAFLRSSEADSLALVMTWVVDKFKEWSHPSAELPEKKIDRDQMLTNVMFYWLSGTAASSARLYYENMHSASWGQAPGSTPTGVAVFAEDVAIRRYAEQSNNIVHWSEFNRGGHFAAMQAPDLLINDIRDFFRPLR
jgi:pimeloyl-ACP methyl ester carboxylesterase